ncbi:MAG: hypothetical protein Q9188_003161 [Gyalolechia gomerana]
MSLGTVTLRPQQRLPEHLDRVDTISLNPLHQIEFKHPAYPASSNTFLILHAFDHPNGGLHYNTAKIACGIITGNRWDGSFRRDVDENDLVYGDDDIMPSGVYYFILPGFNYDSIEDSYPITPNFAEWRFPHDNLPVNWRLPPGVFPNYPSRTQSQSVLAVTIRDNDECRVSGRNEQHEVAHIIPVEEDQWFHTNRMTNYVLDPLRRGQSGISDVNNQLLIRRDIHQSFDKEKKFVFVPKKPSTNASNMVVHLLSPSREYGLLYHNSLTRSLDAVPRQYLFARYAWAIFPNVEPFLLCQISRLLITASKGHQIFKPSECKGFTVTRDKRAGTGSPKKRQKSDKADNQDGASDIDMEDARSVKRIRVGTGSPEDESALPVASGRSSPDVDDRSSSAAQCPSTEPRGALVSQQANQMEPGSVMPVQTVSKDDDPDLDRLRQMIKQALEKERGRSDPRGEWKDDVEWAMETLRNQYSAKDIKGWEEIDEAHRILGSVDDSRDWVQYEDRYGCDDVASNSEDNLS